MPRAKSCHPISIPMVLIGILCLSPSLVVSNPNPLPLQFSKFSRASTKNGHTTKNPKEIFDHSIQLSFQQAQHAQAIASNLSLSYGKAHETHFLVGDGGGMGDCIELLDDTLDLLSNVISHKNNHLQALDDDDDDVQTWLSAALTNQETCSESLGDDKSMLHKRVIDSMTQNLTKSIANSLELYVSNVKGKDKMLNNPSGGGGGGGRRLLSGGTGDFPAWVSAAERELLEGSIGRIQVHAVVARDGSGTHRTIGEAIVGSLAGEGRTVIQVKAGTYHENIKIPTKQKNVMLIGEGKGITVIVASRSNEEGWTTFQSATVAAMGDGFMARDITIVNSAGPAKHQAVALRVGSDKSVIFRCSIQGYQDTLYTHSKRQFYRETDIYGTVDFIFGNSAVVLQNCNIYPRKPLSGQHNFVTAQGRINANQNTGISIHNSKIVAASDLAATKSRTTFLGRPWKQYSRTVIMQSFIDDSIHPSGWSPWSGSFALKTLYYGEYMNSGPGSGPSGRVGWSHPGMTLTEAQAFTVGGFIAGNLWLPSTGVAFDSGLIG
ncbi:pectinesterase/pectinesterase inhibitor 35 [Tripterygium wilfordii]|uniref:Pectinesterase n=2 Tax=Tripterygium wilfordii TaxID=458696 RepID=A0A7J7CIJ7_TRIWF|nr:pectinesterase/pectinesterase inhibitor 35 [Tripterygium wilfordii]